MIHRTRPLTARVFVFIMFVSLVMMAFSPAVVNNIITTEHRLAFAGDLRVSDQVRNQLDPAIAAEPLPEPSVNGALVRDWAKAVASFDQHLQEAKVGEARRARLLEQFWSVFGRAHALLGNARAQEMGHVLERELMPGPDGAAFGTLEKSLISAERWLGSIAFARSALHTERRNISRTALAMAIAASAPYPTDPHPVLENAHWINLASWRTGLPPEVLAAIIDNEMAGGSYAYGLASTLRSIADALALQTARETGTSGVFGSLSRTVGLTQMSWQDALAQRSRFHALELRFGVPFPKTEVEARTLLGQPYANVLLAASRLRGYLNASIQADPLATMPFNEAWVYWAGPAWHSRPKLAQEGRGFEYAFHAFFKACLYAEVLPRLTEN